MPTGKPFNKQEKEEIEKYLRQNAGKKSLEEMSKDLNAANSTVSNYCWRLGLSYELDEKRQKREEIERAIKAYHDKMPGVEIAKMLGVNHNAVNVAAKRIGFKVMTVKREKKPNIISEFFRWKDFNNSVI